MESKVAKYFKKVGSAIVFTGDTLEITLNQRYDRYGFLDIDGSSIKTIGIFDMLVNGSIESGLLLPAVVEIIASDVREVRGESYDQVVVTLQKGDIVIANTTMLRDANLVYAVYYECIYVGARPKFMTYERIFHLFDRISQVTNVDFRVDHALFEAYYAYLYRDAADITKQYRLTKRTKPPMALSMQAVAHVASNTTSKLIGAYFGDALNSALVNQSEQTSSLETTLTK